MNWEKMLEDYEVMIEDRLKRYFRKIKSEAYKYHPFISQLYSKLEEYTLRRGRRIASCSVLLTYKGYTGKVDNEILNVCAGIEIYRHCILIHDDLVDMDVLRRGGKTLHRVLMESHDQRFGEGAAVFLGNIAFALASDLFLHSGFPDEKVVKSLSLLSNGYREVNESQVLDLLFEYKTDVDVDEWRVMASKRAASLFKVTILTGATLGDAPVEDLPRLEEAAVNIGYAFDIQDDIIDTFAEKELYGRNPCGDISLKKKPLHVILTLNSEDNRSSETLRFFQGKKSLNREDIMKIREAIRESGGLESAKRISKKHADKAKRLLKKTSLSDDVKNFFCSFIDYIEESLDWYK